MQFDKVRLFYKHDRKIYVATTVSANGNSCCIVGEPLIEVKRDYIQIGCVRMTKDALLAIAAEINAGETGVIQYGNYKTADPNTRK